MSSLMMKSMTLVLRASKARAARRFARTGGPGPVAAPAEPPASLMKACVVTKRDFEGLPAYEIVPKNAPKPTKTLLYLHGGGYVSPILTAHWWLVHRLAVANGIRVLVPFYQLAPKGTHRDAFPRLLRYYEKALTSAESVIIGGDSAGGGLALALAAQIREAGLTSPARLLLFAPWLDVTMKNPDIGDLANTDPMLTLPRLIEAGRLWAGDDSPRPAVGEPDQRGPRRTATDRGFRWYERHARRRLPQTRDKGRHARGRTRISGRFPCLHRGRPAA
nr:alpha/beta hydrolase [Fodinicola feengrottensis]